MTITTNKNKTLTRIVVVFLLSLTLLANSSDAQRQTRTRARVPRAPAKPKLVLLIVVDHFRYDYLERFGGLCGNGGFKRLMSEGALFTNANYDYVPTFTACGHAAIASGSVPALNGIVGNAFFDRQSELPTTHGSVYTYDTHVPLIVFGPGVRAGRYNADCSPSDISPTIAALLGVEPPSSLTGRVLGRGLRPVQ